MAATNSSWNLGSVAVSIFTTSRAAVSISCACGSRQQRVYGACAGRVADRPHAFERAVGHQAEHDGVDRVDVGPERAGQSDVA